MTAVPLRLGCAHGAVGHGRCSSPGSVERSGPCRERATRQPQARPALLSGPAAHPAAGKTVRRRGGLGRGRPGALCRRRERVPPDRSPTTATSTASSPPSILPLPLFSLWCLGSHSVRWLCRLYGRATHGSRSTSGAGPEPGGAVHAGTRSALPGAARPPGVGDASRSDWPPRRGAGHAHAVAAVLLRQKESAERPVRVERRGVGLARWAGGRRAGIGAAGGSRPGPVAPRAPGRAGAARRGLTASLPPQPLPPAAPCLRTWPRRRRPRRRRRRKPGSGPAAPRRRTAMPGRSHRRCGHRRPTERRCQVRGGTARSRPHRCGCSPAAVCVPRSGAPRRGRLRAAAEPESSARGRLCLRRCGAVQEPHLSVYRRGSVIACARLCAVVAFPGVSFGAAGWRQNAAGSLRQALSRSLGT